MNATYPEMLRENYEKMHTDILIEIKLKGGLTEVAEKILEEELIKRNIDAAEIKEYVESDVANYKPEDFSEGITLGKLASTGSRYVAQIIDQIIALCLAFFVAFEVCGHYASIFKLESCLARVISDHPAKPGYARRSICQKFSSIRFIYALRRTPIAD